MINPPFPYQPALMSAVRARNLSRTYKGLAEQLRSGGMTELADQAERDATWWIAYAQSLAVTPPGRPTETEGLRSARMFDPEQAAEWFAYVSHGVAIGYEPRATLAKLAAFADCISRNIPDVYISKETEAAISAFMQDPRIKL